MLYSEQRCGKEGRVRKTRRERESRGRTLWGSRKTSLSSDSSDWCRIKIVKTIFCCGLRVMFRKARDRGERLVSGRRRQRMNWSRRWAEHHYNQHRFFRRWQKRGRVEERMRWDWWSTEVFSGFGCEGEQGERSNETEKDNAREGEHKSRGSVFRGRLLNSDLSDIMICRATWRACPGSVWREWRGESVE